jgi:hypothetical protein
VAGAQVCLVEEFLRFVQADAVLSLDGLTLRSLELSARPHPSGLGVLRRYALCTMRHVAKTKDSLTFRIEPDTKAALDALAGK